MGFSLETATPAPAADGGTFRFDFQILGGTRKGRAAPLNQNIENNPMQSNMAPFGIDDLRDPAKTF